MIKRKRWRETEVKRKIERTRERGKRKRGRDGEK